MATRHTLAIALLLAMIAACGDDSGGSEVGVDGGTDDVAADSDDADAGDNDAGDDDTGDTEADGADSSDSDSSDVDCTPDCVGRVCGDDGCGGTCGAGCGAGETCDDAGLHCLTADGCRVIEVAPGLEVELPVYRAELLSNLGGEGADSFELQLYTDEVGTVDLASEVNRNFQSCEQCLLIVEDDGTLYLADRGTVDMTQDSSPLLGFLDATITDLRASEVTIDESFLSTPVEGGDCVATRSAFRVATSPAACVPNCAGRVCGDDGCGRSCGPGCEEGETCGEGGAFCVDAEGCRIVSFESELTYLPPIYYEASIEAPPGAPAGIIELGFFRDDVGVRDLQTPENQNYGTCAQCVRVFPGDSKTYFADRGSIDIDPSYAPSSGQFSATISNFRAVEVTIDSNTFESTPVPDGTCVSSRGDITLSTPACVPDCEGKICGDDGCGGVCGGGCWPLDACNAEGTSCGAGAACERVEFPPGMVHAAPGTTFPPTNASFDTWTNRSLEYNFMGPPESDPERVQIHLAPDDVGTFELAAQTDWPCDPCLWMTENAVVDAPFWDREFHSVSGTVVVLESASAQDPTALDVVVRDLVMIENQGIGASDIIFPPDGSDCVRGQPAARFRAPAP